MTGREIADEAAICIRVRECAGGAGESAG